jgi:chaperonin GroES
MIEIKVKTLVPKGNLLTLKADAVETKTITEGGIELPDDAKPVGIKRKGVVVLCGPDVDPNRAIVGERVLFSAHAGTTVEVDGEELELMTDDSILAGIA